MRLRLIAFYLFAFLGLHTFMAHGQDWVSGYGSGGNDELLDACTVPGGLVSVGYFSQGLSIGNSQLLTNGSTDLLIVKTDDDGEVIWTKQFGDENLEKVNAVDADNLGNIYIAGYYQTSTLIGDIPLDAGGNATNSFVAKLDANGDVLWATNIDGSESVLVFDITCGETNDIYVTGQFLGNLNIAGTTLQSGLYDDGTNEVSYDMFLARITPQGDWVWVQQGTGTDDEKGTSVISADGLVFLAGQFSGDFQLDEFHPNTVFNAGFVSCFNTNGEEQWFRQMSALYLEISELTFDNEGDIALIGDAQGDILVNTEPEQVFNVQYDYSAFAAELTMAGELSWLTTITSENRVFGNSLAVDDGGNIHLGGNFLCTYTELSDLYGSAYFMNRGFSDVFTAEITGSGEFLWAKHMGSRLQDRLNSVRIFESMPDPILFGGYESSFLVPSGLGAETHGPNASNLTFSVPCSDCQWTEFVSMSNSGGMDLFIMHSMEEATGLFNPFLGTETCEEQLPYCLRETGPILPCENFCSDTLVICGDNLTVGVDYFAPTYFQEHFFTPFFDFNWSTGEDASTEVVFSPQTLSVELTSNDGCYSHFLEVEVIEATESCPIVVDTSTGEEFECEGEILICEDFTQLEGIEDGYESGSFFEENDVDALTVGVSGTYTYTAIDELGCEQATIVDVFVAQEIEEVEPAVVATYMDVPYYDGDTISNFCYQDFLILTLYDQLGTPVFFPNVHAYWTYEDPLGNVTQFYSGTEEGMVEAQPEHQEIDIITEAGWHTWTIETEIQNPEPCEGVYPQETISLSLYIDVVPNPEFELISPSNFYNCFGTDAIVEVVLGDSCENCEVTWANMTDPIILSDTSVQLSPNDNSGSAVVTTYPSGCSVSDWFFFADPGNPQLELYPGNGIVCPGDSVLIVCPLPGIAYDWIGPLGTVDVDNDSIYVTTPGIYYCTVELAEGCIAESTGAETYEFNTPYLTASPNNDLCYEGQVLIEAQTYSDAQITWEAPLWGNDMSQIVDEPGIYTVQIELCDILTEVSVEVTDTPTLAEANAAQGMLCEGDSVQIFANAGMDSYFWDGEEGTISQWFDEPGSYELLTINTAGCTDSTVFEVIDFLEFIPVFPTFELCSNETVDIQFSGLGDHWYSNSLNDEVVLISNNDVEVGPFSEPVTLYLHQSDSLCGTLVDSVFVPVFDFSIINNDTLLCLPTNITLEAVPTLTDGIDWLWSPAEAVVDPNSFITNITEDAANTFTLTGTDQWGCVIQDEVLIDQIIEMTSIGPDSTICEDEFVTLTTDWPTEYSLEWSDGSGGESTDVNEAGEHWVIATSPEGCVSVDTMLLTVMTYPILEFEDRYEICEGEWVQLNTGYPEINNHWSNETYQAHVNLNVTGEYGVLVDNDYCFTYDTLEIIVHEHPIADIIQDSLLCSLNYPGFITLRSAHGDVHNYEWSTGDTTSMITIDQAGEYSLHLITDFGCVSSTTIAVDDLCDSDLYAPNSFTPNNDGVNDVWKVYGNDIDIIEVQIINRWGETIYRMDDINDYWMGQYQHDGQHYVPDGVYVYQLIYKIPSYPEIFEKTGHIVLIR